MRLISRSRMLALLLIVPGLAAAQGAPIEVQQAWSRAAPQAHTGVLYLTVTATKADRLVGVDTAVADRAELHESRMENGVMTMRAIDGAPVTPGKPLTLMPGGLHIMLINLHRALNAGDTFPVTLHFANAGAVALTALVGKAGAPMPHAMPENGPRS